MSKKHLVIHDADENLDYDISEISENVDEEDVSAPEEQHQDQSENACPECGKDPCECEEHEEIAFTEEEVAALKDLIALVPELKKLLEQKREDKPEEQPAQSAEKNDEDVEEKDEEELDVDVEEKDEDEDEDDEESKSASDSIGSIEQLVHTNVDEDVMTNEAVMAERFRKLYGGK